VTNQSPPEPLGELPIVPAGPAPGASPGYAGPSCACDEISHTLDQFIGDIGGVAKRVEQMAEDVMWLRLKATRDPDFEELDPVKAAALGTSIDWARSVVWGAAEDQSAQGIVGVARVFESYLRDDELHPDYVAPPAADVRRCGVCGCTDDHACQGGCSWVSPDLCSRCAWTPVKDSDVPARAAGGVVGGPVTFEVPFSPVAAEVIRGWTPVADGTESLREQWRAAQTARQLLTVFCARGDHDGCPVSLGVPCTCACHAKAIVP